MLLFFILRAMISVLRRGESLSSEKSEKFSPARPNDLDLSRTLFTGNPKLTACCLSLLLLVVGPVMLLGSSFTRGFAYAC